MTMSLQGSNCSPMIDVFALLIVCFWNNKEMIGRLIEITHILLLLYHSSTWMHES